MKTIIAWMFVIVVMAFSFAGFVNADGIDDPDFYKDFDSCSENDIGAKCRKYDFIAPPAYIQKKKNFDKNIRCTYTWEGCNSIKPQVVPEPGMAELMSIGCAALAIRRWLKC